MFGPLALRSVCSSGIDTDRRSSGRVAPALRGLMLHSRRPQRAQRPAAAPALRQGCIQNMLIPVPRCRSTGEITAPSLLPSSTTALVTLWIPKIITFFPKHPSSWTSARDQAPPQRPHRSPPKPPVKPPPERPDRDCRSGRRGPGAFSWRGCFCCLQRTVKAERTRRI